MEDGTRREPAEVELFLELNSDYHEVIVEGRTDAGLIEEFLRERGFEFDVFPVSDRLNVHPDLVAAAGENQGERGKVVACAVYFSESKVHSRVTCIVDADFHYLTPDISGDLECLLRTDYGAMELYGLTEESLRRLFRVGLRAPKEFDYSHVLEAVSDSLVELYLCRWVFHRANFSPTLLPADKKDRLKSANGRLVLDWEKLIRDSLGACKDPRAREVDVDDILSRIKTARERVSPDLRRYMNGHDYINVLSIYIAKFWPNLLRDDRAGMRKSENLALVLLMTLSSELLESEGMFSALLGRVGQIAC